MDGSSGGDSCVYFHLMNADNETDDGSLAARSRWTSLTMSGNPSLSRSYFHLAQSSRSSNCDFSYDSTSIRQDFYPNSTAQNYDFAWEISSSNAAGRILHNGTLNGATDYSVESGGNGYTNSYVDTNLSGFNIWLIATGTAVLMIRLILN